MRARAKAKITVQSSESQPCDQTASSALMEIHISETFTGDIDVLRDTFMTRAAIIQRHGRIDRAAPPVISHKAWMQCSQVSSTSL
jgi:hypothetical protein